MISKSEVLSSLKYHLFESGQQFVINVAMLKVAEFFFYNHLKSEIKMIGILLCTQSLV
jgi:hypothetical protein